MKIKWKRRKPVFISWDQFKALEQNYNNLKELNLAPNFSLGVDL